MKKSHWLLSFILISFSFFQCQKEVGFVGGPDIGIPVAPDPITTSLQGNITDENDQPAAGVVVTAGTRTAITDAGGYFRFTNVTLDKNTSLITATKEGYFKGYRVLAATSGCNQVAIKLIRKDLAGTVPASSGGEATLSNGAKVSLPAGGVVMASSNAAYTGEIKVYASYINPASSDIGKTIPGSLVANSKEGKRVVLSSYGMLAVELFSASGEKLQIKSGSTATLTIPIPISSVASAPATLSLWYVDETTGIWQEEGSATKQGSNYIGEVKHFSYWNCDYPYDAVNLSFTLQTPDGLPLVNAYVEIRPTGSDSSLGGLAHGYTDSLGQVKGLVPANKSLTMLVYNECYGVIYSQSFSPINQSTDLGVIKVSNAASSILTLSGTLLDCNNKPVSNGYAIITYGASIRYAKTDSVTGKFTTTYVLCSGIPASVSIIGVDNATRQQSNALIMNTILPVTDAGTIATCGTSSEQFINYTLDGVDYTITDALGDSSFDAEILLDSSTSITGRSPVSGTFAFFSNGRTIGTFPITGGHIDGYVIGDLDPSTTVTFTEFPAHVGDFFAGSLIEKFIDDLHPDSLVVRNVTGTFRVRRTR